MNRARQYGLQLMAGNLNTNVTTAVASGNNLAAECKEFYNTELIRLAEPNLVYVQFAKKIALPKGNGKTVSIRQFDPYEKATTPLVEGVTPDGNKMNVREISATINQYGDYTSVSDVLEMAAVDPVITEVTQAHASQASQTLDTVCRNEIMAGTNVVYAPKSDGTAITSRNNITDDCKVTPDVIAKVAAILKTNNAPKIDGSYVGIVHPHVSYDIQRNPEFIDVHKYGENAEIFEGEIGKLYGVRFVETSEAKIWEVGSDTKVHVYGSLFIGANAYATVDPEGGSMEIIVKQRGSGGTADPLEQRSTVGWKASTVNKILIPEYIVRVESGSALGSTAVAN
nr:MAG TPA: major capsid protein [Caudoviricetes sp.]